MEETTITDVEQTREEEPSATAVVAGGGLPIEFDKVCICSFFGRMVRAPLAV